MVGRSLRNAALLSLVALSLFGLCVSSMASPEYIWGEAESADKASFPVKATSESSEFSGGSWVKEGIPESGTMSYKLQTQQAGDYHLWLRMGMEYVRATFRWRIDNGDWKTIGPNDLSTNLTAISFWTELSWLNAGVVNLSQGDHVLEVEFGPKTGDNMVAAFDCFCLVQGDWVPDGKLKPGEHADEDIDNKAAAQVFHMPEAVNDGSRQSIKLDGLWQVARYDDLDMNTDRYEPVKEMPRDPKWRGIQIPCDYAGTLPALRLAHRVWFRTKVDIPQSMAGHSYILDFGGTSWIASVMVNGQLLGWRKSTGVPWQCDITAGIKPGQVNEICIGIKDFYYAIDDANLNKTRNIPYDALRQWQPHFVAPIIPTTKGDTDGMLSGIIASVNLTAVGAPTYVSDVFVKTSVTDQQFKPTNKVISADITLSNPTSHDCVAKVSADVFSNPSSQAEKQLPATDVTVPAGGTKLVTLSALWPDAKLWWPQQNNAAMYTLKTSVSVDGKRVDLCSQPFGFREVKVDGKYIRINGLRRNFWNLLGGFSGDTDAQRLASFYASNNRFERFSADINGQVGSSNREEQLTWADQHGIAGRLSTMIDGMSITYTLENELTWQNFKEHIDQVVKRYRNHPSVIIYSLENELLFINGALTRDAAGMDVVEDKAQKYLVDPAKAADPTRPVMLDGGGAFKNNTVDICCTHYAEDGFHPDNSYPLDKIISQKRWSWDMKRPYCAGEVAYFAGNNSDHAWIGGEQALAGKSGALKSYAKYLKYLFERYRWNDVAVICPWTGTMDTQECWNAMSDLAVFTREYNSSFFSGNKLTRTVKVFNDSFSANPVTFGWKLLVNGKTVGSGSQQLSIEPGFNKQSSLSCVLPKVAVRTSAQLVLEVSQQGNTKRYKDVKPIIIFPAVSAARLARPVYVLEPTPVFSKQLSSIGIKATSTSKIGSVPTRGIAVVAPNTISDKQPISDIMAFAKQGGRVIFLEQEQPILGDRFGAPIEVGNNLEKQPYCADFAFAQQGTKLLDGLDSLTLSNWAGYSTSKTVWHRTTGAVRSWITCGPALNGTTLIEMPTGIGEVIATQMCVGSKLKNEPAAQVLLMNMLKRADGYSVPSKSVGIYASANKTLADYISGLGCRQKAVSKISDGLNVKTNPVFILEANAQNIETLLKLKAQTDAYTASGGYIMLFNLQPDGLSAFNKLMGTQHVMREFRREVFRPLNDPLMAGISYSDLSQYTDQVIAPWSGQRNVSRDVFTYCLDGEDIAPFCFGAPNPNYPEMNGNGPYNLVNGLFNSDMWWYIDQISYDPGKPENQLVELNLPMSCKLKSISIWNNKNYDTVKLCDVRLDGKSVAKVELPDSYDAVDVALKGAVVKIVALSSLSVRQHGDSKLVGLDEVSIIRELPSWYQGRVYPMVSCGGLIRYPRGKGGIILNQLKLDENGFKDFAENQAKKRRITSSILQNLDVAFDSSNAANQSTWQLGTDGLPNYIPPEGKEHLKNK